TNPAREPLPRGNGPPRCPRCDGLWHWQVGDDLRRAWVPADAERAAEVVAPAPQASVDPDPARLHPRPARRDMGPRAVDLRGRAALREITDAELAAIVLPPAPQASVLPDGAGMAIARGDLDVRRVARRAVPGVARAARTPARPGQVLAIRVGVARGR